MRKFTETITDLSFCIERERVFVVEEFLVGMSKIIFLRKK
jgi:hypothetical protein